MKRLVSVEVEGVRRAIEVKFEVGSPVVVLQGPNGSGKSSVLDAIEWGLSGQNRDEFGKTRNKDQIRNPNFNAWVDLVFIDEEAGEEVLIHRELTAAGTHSLTVNGSSFTSLGDANAYLEDILGCSLDQLGYLTSASRLVQMSGLDQADLICGLMGADMTWADLEARCEGVPEPPVPADTDLTGWPLIQEALKQAEQKRLEQGREAKALEGKATELKGALGAACKEARIPGPDNIDGAAKQLLDRKQRAEQHRDDVVDRQAAAEAHQRKLSEAQERLAVAQQRVSELREKREAADAVREEREAERAKLKQAVEEAEAGLADAQTARNEAKKALDAASEHMHSTRRTLREKPTTYECPSCEAQVALIDGELVPEADIPAPEVTQEDVDAAETTFDEANAAFGAAEKVVHKWATKSVQAERALEDCPPVPAADELEAQFDEAVAEADRAHSAYEELQGADVPDKPTPQEVEAAEKALNDVLARQDGITRAISARKQYREAKEKAEAADAEYKRYDALVKRLREIVRETADEAIGPVIERSNTMLPPGLELDYDADAGIVAAYGEQQRPVSELSTGERLMVGATLQASVAIVLEVGVCLVDEASAWDPETLGWMLTQMAELGEEHAITWIVTTSQDVPCIDEVQVEQMDGGYSV